MQQLLKDLIVDRVRTTFNDRAHGEEPVRPSDDGLLGPDSVAWRVHGDLTTMMIGGLAGLLLQMLHPGVLAGVWDHSRFREDMHGRLRRTARFIALTTYGSRAEAEAAIARVRAIHRHVRGALPDGTAYHAQDPELLAWVHATETLCFLDAWQRYSGRALSLADQDRYFAEMAVVGEALGVVAAPRSRADMLALVEHLRPQLRADARSREVARIILDPPAQSAAMVPVQRLTIQAGVDLLPRWARRMHGLRSSRLSRPLVRAGTYGIAETLRWAFR
jgi:uncharacterized protein (DUF2236 family)